MAAFLNRMRWAVLLACYVVVVRVCQLFQVPLPMDSFWRPHNLRRFRPYYLAPRTLVSVQIPRRRRSMS